MKENSSLIIMCFALLLLLHSFFLSARKIDNPIALLMNWLRNGKEIKTYRAVGENQEIDVPGFKTLVLSKSNEPKVNFLQSRRK